MRARLLGLLLLTGLCVGAGAVVPARAAAAPVPIVDCITPNTSGVGFWVYFGYANAGAQEFVDFGDSNQIVPGLGYQGQPTVFNPGVYPRVFRAVFNSSAFQSISWELAGSSAVASLNSPRCLAGQTGPATTITSEGATLTAQLEPDIGPISYRFEYGTTPALGESTPNRQVTTSAELPVSEPISGLQPATIYFFRLSATNSLTATVGEQGTFTTAALPAAPPTTPPSAPQGDTTTPPGPAPPANSPAPPVTTFTPAPALADLVVTRTGAQRAIRIGRTVTLHYAIKNAGQASADGAVLTVRLAPGVTRLRVNGATCTGRRTVRCTLGSLAPAATKTVSVRVRVRSRARHADVATVVSTGADATTANNVVDGVVRGRR